MKRRKRLTDEERVIAWAKENDHTVTLVPASGFRWEVQVRAPHNTGTPTFWAFSWYDVWYQIQTKEHLAKKSVKYV